MSKELELLLQEVNDERENEEQLARMVDGLSENEEQSLEKIAKKEDELRARQEELIKSIGLEWLKECRNDLLKCLPFGFLIGLMIAGASWVGGCDPTTILVTAAAVFCLVSGFSLAMYALFLIMYDAQYARDLVNPKTYRRLRALKKTAEWQETVQQLKLCKGARKLVRSSFRQLKATGKNAVHPT